MPRKRYSTEQIVTKLRQAEVELGRGLRTPEMCKKLGISEQTYYRWRKEYGGLGLIRFGGHLPKGEYDVDHDGDEGQADAAELHG